MTTKLSIRLLDRQVHRINEFDESCGSCWELHKEIEKLEELAEIGRLVLRMPEFVKQRTLGGAAALIVDDFGGRNPYWFVDLPYLTRDHESTSPVDSMKKAFGEV